jgi:hypothetical protein
MCVLIIGQMLPHVVKKKSATHTFPRNDALSKVLPSEQVS